MGNSLLMYSGFPADTVYSPMLYSPVDSAFLDGTLCLSRVPDVSCICTDIPVDNLLTDTLSVASVLVAVIFLKKIVEVIPSLLGCLVGWKEAMNLEFSMKLSRDRNTVFLILLLPFCLLVNRYSLYSPGFMDDMNLSVRLLCVGGVFFAYLSLRFVLMYFIKGSKRYKEAFNASNMAFLTFFCTMTLFSLVTAGAMSLFGAGNSLICTVLRYELLALYVLLLIRRGQILGNSCSIFSTILYLCVLEILPTVCLVVSALVF